MLTFPNSSYGGGFPPIGEQLGRVIMPPVYTVNVILGLLGHIVALWIFCFKLKTWNPNHLFLFNLVFADFMALFRLPLRIDSLLRGHWVFGDGLCRINLFLMFTNRSASIALMTVVAIYRYFKVRKGKQTVSLCCVHTSTDKPECAPNQGYIDHRRYFCSCQRGTCWVV